MPIETDADPMTPYQLPFPKEALDEIIIPDAMPKDDRLWPQAEMFGFDLCLNRSQILTTLLKVRVLSRHRHPGCARICFERPLALFRT